MLEAGVPGEAGPPVADATAHDVSGAPSWEVPDAAEPRDAEPADGRGLDARPPLEPDGAPPPGRDDAGGPDAGRPDAGAARPLVVAIISDLNGGYGNATYEVPVHAAVRRIVAARPDLVLSAGDMVAGQRAGLDYRAMWRGFHAAVSDPLAAAGIPLAVCPGNHDASAYPGFEEERRIFAEEWEARRPAVEFTDDADYPFRYSFRVGAAHFVALDDTRVGPLPAPERAWIATRIDANPAPVTVVFGHVPIRPFTVGREDEVLGDDALEALLAERGVDVFVAGHHHGYFPGRHGGLRQLSMPCLGGGPRALVGTGSASARGLVFLRLDGSEITELEGYTGAAMDQRIERASLPERIGVVLRDDL